MFLPIVALKEILQLVAASSLRVHSILVAFVELLFEQIAQV